jgi:SHS2 domain-containing protein
MNPSDTPSGFEFVEHTADVKVKCWGPTLEEAFSQAAYGLIATITPNLELIANKMEKTIEVKAEDKEALLYDFLSEFLFFFDVEKLVFGSIKVKSIEKKGGSFDLNALLKGEQFNRDKHELGTEVKAITYSYMTIEQTETQTTIEIVFDI